MCVGVWEPAAFATAVAAADAVVASNLFFSEGIRFGLNDFAFIFLTSRAFCALKLTLHIGEIYFYVKRLRFFLLCKV